MLRRVGHADAPEYRRSPKRQNQRVATPRRRWRRPHLPPRSRSATRKTFVRPSTCTIPATGP